MAKNQFGLVGKNISYSFSKGYFGEKFKAREDRPFNSKLFTEKELSVLEKVSKAFKLSTTNDIVEISHLEDAWINNEKDKNVISYKYAFDLTQI